MRFIRFLFGLVVLGGLAGVGFIALTLWYFNRDLPDYTQLGDYQPPVVTRIQAGDGRLLAEYATEKRVFVPVKAMPPLVTKAFLAAEDKNFYSHPGVDFEAMIRAGLMDVVRHFAGRRPVGASTITQQVAKNFLVGNELSIQRKIREALLALKMEPLRCGFRGAGPPKEQMVESARRRARTRPNCAAAGSSLFGSGGTRVGSAATSGGPTTPASEGAPGPSGRGSI